MASDYRKIWVDNHGPIPIDEDGRSYEIHHIDGDRSNNSIENLICISIEEHFDIHYSQGDIGACQALLFRMSKTPEELSELQSKLSTLNNAKRIKDGTHNFLDPGWREKYFDNKSSKRVEDGTHNFLEKDFQSKVQKKRLEEGRHNFGSDFAKERERKKKEINGPIIEEIKSLKKENGMKLPKNWHHRSYVFLIDLLEQVRSHTK